jgi:hypothetical protein
MWRTHAPTFNKWHKKKKKKKKNPFPRVPGYQRVYDIMEVDITECRVYLI